MCAQQQMPSCMVPWNNLAFACPHLQKEALLSLHACCLGHITSSDGAIMNSLQCTLLGLKSAWKVNILHAGPDGLNAAVVHAASCSLARPCSRCAVVKRRAQGQKTKSFRYQLMNQEGQDLYMQVEMNETGKQQQRYGLPVTRGEHEVITRIAKVTCCLWLGIPS